MTTLMKTETCFLSIKKFQGPVMTLYLIQKLIWHDWFKYWPGSYLATIHHRNQIWLFVNWIIMNKLQWKLNQNTKKKEKMGKKFICKMADILFRSQCVETLWPSDTWHRTGSTLAWVMECCHYLNKCWVIISNKVQWRSPEGKFTRDT